MHMPGHIRERILDAFELSWVNENEWWQNFKTRNDLLIAIGGLWNCTDTVPHSTREEAADWVAMLPRWDDEGERKIRQGCSYATMVRILKRHLPPEK